MTDEGTFPKIDGDTFFASEANRNHNNTYIGSTIPSNQESGTDWVEVGSIVIPAGSFTNPAFMRFSYIPNESRTGFRLEVSGESANVEHVFHQPTTSSTNFMGNSSILVGSPLNGFINNYLMPLQNAAVGDFIGGFANINNLYAGSEVVFKFNLRAASAGSKFITFALTPN